MATIEKQLTINLPESTEMLNKLLVILRQYGLVSKKKIETIQQNHQTETPMESPKKSRWAMAADRLQSEGFLKGHGEEVQKLTQDFKENFSL